MVFESRGCRLVAMLGVPSHAEPNRRGVVFIHGWAGYRIGPHRILTHAARRLLAEGFCTLRFDLRGRGDSDGEAATVCLDEMISDTPAAADYLASETPVARVSLLGICSGANVAIGAATLRPETFEELVLWSALPFQPEQRARQRIRRARYYAGQYLQKAFRLETWKRLLRGEVDVKRVGRTIAGDPTARAEGRNLKDSSRDIMSAFAQLRGRALFVIGTDDPEGMEGRNIFTRACRAAKIEADFHLVEGATHSFYARAHEEEVIETTVAWLKK